MHPAEEYLRNPENTPSLYVVIQGKKRRLFINRDVNQIGIVAPGKKTHGYLFTQWNSIERIIFPEDESKKQERDTHLTSKFKKLAMKAEFTNSFIRKCLSADVTKSPYDNRLTCGTKIDGEVITFKALEKWYPFMDKVRNAIKNKKTFHSARFDFRGYDGSISVEPKENGDVCAYLNKEYKGCGNGYYYIAINEDCFIGVDID